MEEVVNLPYFQCIKTSLRKVVRDEIVIEKLENAAVQTNRIMTHGLQFLKLYLIHCFDQGDNLPMIDKPFVNAVFKILCKAPTIGRKPSEATQELKSKLTQFYQEHYEYLALDTDTMQYKNLNTVLDYMSIEVITMYNNNKLGSHTGREQRLAKELLVFPPTEDYPYSLLYQLDGSFGIACMC